MSKALTVADKPKDLITFDEGQIGLIKRTIAKGATDDELSLFLHQCKRTGLDPLAKQIYFQKRFNKRANRFDITIITGIDGYRLVAGRTGEHAGTDDAVFDDESSPKKASVTTWRIVKGMRVPFAATARWSEYYPGDEQGFMWRKMPCGQLAKCAEALALRKAFPAELSGVYTKEEMEQAGPPEAVHPEVPVEAEYVPFEGPKAVLQAKATSAPVKIYRGDTAQQQAVFQILKHKKIPDDFWEVIHNRLTGQPVTALDEVIEEVRRG